MIIIVRLVIMKMIIIKICSNTNEMEDILDDFLKADALISAMEEKLEIM